MAVLSASNNKLHWGNNPATDLIASHFTGAKVDYGIKLIDDQVIGAITDHVLPSGDTVYYQYEYNLISVPSSGEDGYYARIYDSSNTILAEMNLSNGNVSAKVYGDTTVTGVFATPLTTLSINQIKIKIVVNAGEVTMELYVGGVLVSTATSLNVGGKGVAARFDFATFDAMPSQYNTVSQFVASDTDLGNNGFTKLSPASAGLDTDLSGGFANLSDDDSATGISGTSAGNKSSYNMAVYSGGDLISSYVATSVISAGAGAPANFRFYLIIGGVRYYGTTQPIAANSTIIAQEHWATDPSDSLVWTQAKINATQVGIELVA